MSSSNDTPISDSSDPAETSPASPPLSLTHWRDCLQSARREHFSPDMCVTSYGCTLEKLEQKAAIEADATRNVAPKIRAARSSVEEKQQLAKEAADAAAAELQKQEEAEALMTEYENLCARDIANMEMAIDVVSQELAAIDERTAANERGLTEYWTMPAYLAYGGSVADDARLRWISSATELARTPFLREGLQKSKEINLQNLAKLKARRDELAETLGVTPQQLSEDVASEIAARVLKKR